ncbi:hypothetical protein L0Y65_04225 [Candidatus Micrarchaeota archaeon]|nr:hypothetical protein [Candidatus Micrarchaeota archaeon]
MGPASTPPKNPQNQQIGFQNAQLPPGQTPLGAQRLPVIGHAAPQQQKPSGIVTPWGEPASEYLRRQEGKVEYVELFSSAGVQKDYGSYMMVFDGRRFKKCPHMVKGYEEPTDAEIERFRWDVADAAKGDKRIAMLINQEPCLRAQRGPERL